MLTRESGVCGNKGEWSVGLQGRVECVATREGGVYADKGEWSICLRENRVATRESGVYAYERIEWQKERVECMAAILFESEVTVCKCIREWKVWRRYSCEWTT